MAEAARAAAARLANEPAAPPRSGPAGAAGGGRATHLPEPGTGYTVGRLAPERAGAEAEAARDDDRLVTVVGALPDLTPGEAIVAHAWWRNDAKHGWQFQAREYRATPRPRSRTCGSTSAATRSRTSGRSTPAARGPTC
jgi:hypothetical protein